MVIALGETAPVMRFNARGTVRRIVGSLDMQRVPRATLERVGAAFLVVVVLAIGITVWHLRRGTLADTLVGSDNLAIVLAEQTSRSVQAVDIVLRDVQDRIAELGVATPTEFRSVLRTQEMREFLRSRKDRLPQVNDLTLIGDDGTRVNNSLDGPVPAGNLSDREDARHFTAQDDRSLFISEPTVNRATHVSSIYLVRRVNGPHGEFLGMVIGAVPIKEFAELYRLINLPRGESFVLLRRDGTVLIRHPDPVDRAGTKLPAGSPWFGLVAQGGGFYESPGVFDTITRLVAVRPLRDYPLVMNVSIVKDAVLA